MRLPVDVVVAAKPAVFPSDPGRVSPEAKAALDAVLDHYSPVVARIADRVRLPIGMDRDDLRQSGYLGLLKAVLRYNPAKTSNFDVYLYFTGYHNIANEMYKLAFPVHLNRELVRRHMASIRGSDRAGRSSADVDRAFARLDQRAAGRAIAHVPDPSDDPSELVELRDEVSWFLRRLDGRSAYVLVRRYGLDGGPAATYREIARDLGVCRERIRQQEEKALTRLGAIARVRDDAS